MARKPMFKQMADDIKQATVEIVERYQTRIDRRKCSRSLVYFWMFQGVQDAIKENKRRMT